MGGGGTDFMANWTYMKEQDMFLRSLLCLQMGMLGIAGVIQTIVTQCLLSTAS